MGWRIRATLIVVAVTVGIFKGMNWTERVTRAAEIWAMKEMIEEIEKMMPDEWKENLTECFDRTWNATKELITSTWNSKKETREIELFVNSRTKEENKTRFSKPIRGIETERKVIIIFHNQTQ